MDQAIEFGDLVGAQVRALVEGELEGAEESWRFIEQVGFRKDADGKLILQSVSFDMLRRDTDGEVRTHTIQIPVLTLLPLPLLTIDEANIDFHLTIEEVKTKSVDSGGSQPRSSLLSRLVPRKSRSSLVTRVARTRTTDNQTTSADMKVTVRLRQSEFPLGIERLLNTADLGVQDEVNES